ncbi:MAG: DUF2070 family protein [Spirochaetales bacterium]|jgi:hypothetical protein|nr:DUF2070 family protein [Spirochaetales bacterium]
MTAATLRSGWFGARYVFMLLILTIDFTLRHLKRCLALFSLPSAIRMAAATLRSGWFGARYVFVLLILTIAFTMRHLKRCLALFSLPFFTSSTLPVFDLASFRPCQFSTLPVFDFAVNLVFRLLSAAGARARGIVAESPQEAHWRFRGLGAESPVFFGQGICGANSLTEKNAPEDGRFPIGNLLYDRCRGPGMRQKKFCAFIPAYCTFS